MVVYIGDNTLQVDFICLKNELSSSMFRVTLFPYVDGDLYACVGLALCVGCSRRVLNVIVLVVSFSPQYVFPGSLSIN